MILFIVVALIAFTARLAAAEPNADVDLDDDVSRTAAADAASVGPVSSDAGATDDREVARHDRAARIGRVDLTVMWRRTVRVADMRGTAADDGHPAGMRPGGADPDGAHAAYGTASPLDPVTTARGVLWVLLTWSR